MIANWLRAYVYTYIDFCRRLDQNALEGKGFRTLCNGELVPFTLGFDPLRRVLVPQVSGWSIIDGDSSIVDTSPFHPLDSPSMKPTFLPPSSHSPLIFIPIFVQQFISAKEIHRNTITPLPPTVFSHASFTSRTRHTQPPSHRCRSRDTPERWLRIAHQRPA